MPPISRRAFVAGVGATAAATALATSRAAALATSTPAFNVSVLSDEISQDLGRALEVAVK